jgi:hypothetical protein
MARRPQHPRRRRPAPRVEHLEDRTTPSSLLAVGAGDGGAPLVRGFDALTRAETLHFAALNPAFAGGVRVAVADVTGDGTPDVVAGAGPGGGPDVKVFDGKTGAEVSSVSAFESSFTGGVFVAAADFDRDGFADLVVTPDRGGGPRVRVLSGKDGGVLADFFGIDDPNFRGGARAAAADLNADGTPDLLVAAGFTGGPRVAAFNGQSLADPQPVKLFPDFFAFEQALRNGVFLTGGDLDGDGFAEVIAGGGPGGGPRVLALSGRDLVQSGVPVQVANFFAGDAANRGGVRVAAGDLDGDAVADLVVGSGDGAGSRVTGYAGKSIPADGTPPDLFAFDAFPGFLGGVFTGVGPVAPTPPPTAPTVTLSSPAPGLTNLAAIPVTVTFSQPVTGFDAGDLVLGNATAANFRGSGAVYTFDLVASGQGAVLAFIPGGAATSGAGLGNVQSNPLTRTVDTVAPAVLSVVPVAQSTPRGSFVDAADVTFSEPLAPGSFDRSDLTVPGPGGANLVTPAVTVTQTGPATYRVAGLYGLGVSDYRKWFTPLDPNAVSTVTLTVDAGGVSDPAGNTNPAAAGATWDLGDVSLRDLYVFRSPANANNTVLVLTLAAFPGNPAAHAPAALFPGLTYRLNVDTTGDGVADLAFAATFGTPGATGAQSVTLTRVAGDVDAVVATGQTDATLPVTGGGMVRAGVFDDPFFFDLAAFNLFVAGGTFPRPVGTAHNFYGPNGNVMALVLEVPSATIGPTNSVVGVWGAALSGGSQVDRVGRPLALETLIPPLPRGGSGGFPDAARNIRDFLTGGPAGDVAAHKAGAVAILRNFFGRTAAVADTLANLLLPDMMMFQVGNPNGFGTFIGPGGSVLGNGRRLADDAADALLSFLTGGQLTTDNVGDDNGLRVTDGSVDPVSGKTRAIAFPYVGLANLPLDGPGTGPNP